MKTIPLTQGKVAIVDDEDFVRLNQWKWHCTSKGYAARKITVGIGQQSIIYMHRVIMNAPANVEVDHRNEGSVNNRCDNRKMNLRLASASQNKHNRKKYRNNTSGYKGVTFHKRDRRFHAQIEANGKHIFIGSFPTAKEAADKYDTVAKELHGKFARTNAVA